MPTRVQIKVEMRRVQGKKVRALRRGGVIPANVYGPGRASDAVQVDAGEFRRALAQGGLTSLYDLRRDGSDVATVLVREVQRHPVHGGVLHVDFYAAALTEVLRTNIPVQLEGEASGVRLTGGALIQVMESIEVECLPGDLPQQIVVDVSGIAAVGDAVHIRGLTPPAGVRFVTDPGQVVVHLERPRVAEEEAGVAAPGVPAGAEAAQEDEG